MAGHAGPDERAAEGPPRDARGRGAGGHRGLASAGGGGPERTADRVSAAGALPALSGPLDRRNHRDPQEHPPLLGGTGVCRQAVRSGDRLHRERRPRRLRALRPRRRIGVRGLHAPAVRRLDPAGCPLAATAGGRSDRAVGRDVLHHDGDAHLRPAHPRPRDALLPALGSGRDLGSRSRLAVRGRRARAGVPDRAGVRVLGMPGSRDRPPRRSRRGPAAAGRSPVPRPRAQDPRHLG